MSEQKTKTLKTKDVCKTVTDIQYNAKLGADGYRFADTQAFEAGVQAYHMIVDTWVNDLKVLSEQEEQEFNNLKAEKLNIEKTTSEIKNVADNMEVKGSKFMMVGYGLSMGLSMTGLVLGEKNPFRATPDETLKMAGYFATILSPMAAGLVARLVYDNKAKKLRKTIDDKLPEDKKERYTELFDTKEELTQGLRTAAVLEEMLENFANDNDGAAFESKGYQQKYQEHLTA